MSNLPAHGTLVTGDFIIDQHIYEGERYRYADHSPGVMVKVEVGGAGLLADLLKVLLNPLKGKTGEEFSVVEPARTPPVPDPKVASGLAAATPHAHHSYAFWRRRPVGKKRDEQTWHCVDAMGFGSPRHVVTDADDCNPSTCSGIVNTTLCAACDRNILQPAKPALIVISDGGMGFRDHAECWEPEKLAGARHILLKTANHPTTSPLWSELARHADRLTVVVSAAELRKTDARISSGLTWEETFQDFLRELDSNGSLADLTRCKTLLVAIDNEAAIAVEFATPGVLETAVATFVYRGGEIESDVRSQAPGMAFGFLTCFTAAATRSLAQGTPWAQGMVAGLSAMRDLASQGHGPATEKPIGFPVGRIAKVIESPQSQFVSVRVPIASLKPGWTFLKLSDPSATSRLHPAFELARLTAIYGNVAITNLPHLKLGDLVSVDDDEITAYRNLRQVLTRYRDTPDENKPLSIGIFGPPGSGKSYAVKQIANNMLGAKTAWLDFNLSQFEGPRDLIGAFHQIRDCVLQGKLPVAFFDEFDSRSYEWLQYLLAPMQDGKFQEGESTHTVGRCIFVFAGGTSWTFESFGPPATDQQATTQFIMAKGPDFKSRLDAFLNVVGPNPRVEEAMPPPPENPSQPDSELYPVGGRWMREVDADIWWPIRRALFLRSKLGLKPDDKLTITPRLLNALLRVPRYRHGSRSLEKILFSVRAANMYTPSYVPNHSQLELHTDAATFLKLLDQPVRSAPVKPDPLTDQDLRMLAAAIHDTWNALMIASGYKKPDEVKSLAALQQECDAARARWNADEAKLKSLPAAEVDAEKARLEKVKAELDASQTRIDSNVGAAQRMPRILEIIGLRLVPGDAWSADDEAHIRRLLEFHLDLLASEEHREWMEWYFQRGWTYHSKRSDLEQRHNCLKPYSELPEIEKLKDQSAIRHYPDFARQAGYRIEPIP